MRKINKIIVHCSDSPQGRGDTAKDIDLWHKQRGFKRTYEGKTYHIGYHFVLLEDGFIEAGRPLEISGAHCKGHNADSIGICLIGKNEFTDKQFNSLRDLIKGLMIQYKLKIDNVYGHRDFSNKTCPNFDVNEFKKEYLLKK